MDQMLRILGPISYLTVEELIVSFLLCFVLSSAVAYVYRVTYQGLSYSRSFVQAQILGSLAAAMVIMAIGNNLARGLGLLGTLAIVRFRTQIREPRDMMFIFVSLGIGIAAGAQAFTVVIVGTAFFCAAALYLRLAPFASRREYDGLLRFVSTKDAARIPKLSEVLSEYCSSRKLVAARDSLQGEGVEYAYQVRLADPSYQPRMVEELSRIAELSDVTFVMQRSTVEQ